MKFKKKIAAIGLSIGFLLSACSGNSGQSTGDDGDTIKIGGQGPLTGNLAEYGVTSMNGAQLAIDEINANGGINGKQIEFILEDDKGDNTEAINVYNKLVDSGVHAILGSITSGPSEAIASLAQADNMPLLTPTGTQYSITQGRENVFRVAFTDPFQGQILAQYVSEAGFKTAALMKNNSNDYSDGVFEAFKTEASELGIEIVAEESYGNDDTDFRVQLTNIASKNPDVLLIPDYYSVDALIITQARETGIKSQIIGPDGWDGVLTQLTESDQAIANGVVFTNHYSVDDPSENVQNFIKNYKEKFGTDPTAFSALSYDGIYLFKEAFEKAESTDKQAIVDSLKASDFSGITGNLKFDENNNPIKAVSMIVVQDGSYKLDRVVIPQ